jgi:hypothetical protein
MLLRLHFYVTHSDMLSPTLVVLLQSQLPYSRLLAAGRLSRSLAPSNPQSRSIIQCQGSLAVRPVSCGVMQPVGTTNQQHSAAASSIQIHTGSNSGQCVFVPSRSYNLHSS